MTNNCSILRVDKLLIVNALQEFLKAKDTDTAINQFINSVINPEVKLSRRVKINELDTQDEIEKFVKKFIIAFDEKIEDKLNSGESIATLSKLSKAVHDRLMVEADKHLVGVFSENDNSDEDKTAEEVQDRYRAKTEEHMKEFYGAGSTVNSIKTYFKDQIITAAYWDVSGPIVAHNDDILNIRIQEFKDRQYRYIVEFLQNKGLLSENASKSMIDEDGNFINFEYYDTLERFYQYFKTAKEEDPETRQLLTAQDRVIRENQQKLNNSQRQQKENLYALLIESIQSDNPLGFRQTSEGHILSNAKIKSKLKEINDKVKKLWSVNALKRAKYELYTTGRLSNYYRIYKKYLTENNLGNVEIVVKSESKNPLTMEEIPAKVMTINEIFDSIESESIGILPATRAYTILTHFDDLLKENGNKIDFPKSLEGVVTVNKNKYKHHQDTAHEKKSWQTSEDMSSERSTAELTKAVFERINIYDYKTDQSSDRRVDTTKFIVASHNLLDDIIFRRIEFTGENAEVKNEKVASIHRFAKEFREAVADLHKNSVRSFQKMLQLLFDNGEFNLVDVLSFRNTSNKRLLTTTDINVLYSVYNAIFNKNNPVSLLSAELENAKSSNNVALSLVGEIAGYVDRNASVHYMETSVDPQTGRIKIVVKRKFSNRIPLKKTIDKINNINRKSKQEARELSQLCNLEYPTDNGSGDYRITLGINNPFTYEIEAPKIGLRILNSDLSVNSKSREQLKKLEAIDLIDFRNKEINGIPFNKEEQQLHDLLNFIEKALDIKIITNPGFNLQILQIYKDIYNPGKDTTGLQGEPARSKGYSGALEPLLMMAIRAAYANKRRTEMFNLNEDRVNSGLKPLTLKEYLLQLDPEDNDGIYDTFQFNKDSTAFKERFDEVSYRIASYQDEFLSDWEDAKAMLTGEASRATTKDKEGNSIPNNSVNKLGNILPYYLRKQKKNPKSQVDELMFVNNPELLLTMYHDLEVTAQNGESKIIKSFSSGELFFHSIFNKFWGNYLNKGSVVIQPTVYSDKTTFLNWEISTKILNFSRSDENDNDILSLTYNNPELYQAIIIKKYGDTIGATYRKIWETTEAKLKRIAAEYNRLHNTEFSYVEVLNRHNENSLIALANSIGENLELDKDYRIVKDNNGNAYCTYNEMLKYNAEYLYAEDSEEKYSNLEKFLNQQKSVFVSNLLNANSSFQVIDFNDRYENYIDAKVNGNSRNVIVKTILDYFGENNGAARKKFFEEWVDKKTGKLIIAKTNDGKNIIGVGDNYKGEPVILNPFLDKFFYVEGLLSNNLRMSLTGSEINHPNKAYNTLYNQIKNQKNVNNQIFLKSLAQELNTPVISELTAKNIKEYLDNTRSIHDIDLDTVPENIKPFIEDIYHKSMESIINTAQGTQFKRNVIIPATLQYCRQNAFDGIPEKIRCAVIRDVKAPVYNYRGDKKGSIDAADGSARITPFQSILENKSLDSQAVGFIKKPIWHAYDSESGTAFLAKFATDTITNEEMRVANGAPDSLFNLFKKMTNIQWEEPIDLTTTVGLPKDALEFTRNNWFKTKILGNVVVNGEIKDTQRLFYKNSYGEIIRIFSLKKSTSEKKDINDVDIYYTEELAADYEDTYLDEEGNRKSIKKNKVYHLFYDEVDDNGKVIKKSVHKTFDSYQKARAFLNDGNNINVHTINSLFELHTALGGINCVDSAGKDSEFVNEVVVNYMNNICKIREGHSITEIRDQETFYQPLKKYHIGYALNNTAVKNGAKNINEASAWSDDSDLKWFEVDSDGLGMQMNADHDIINSELTEFSQVITATSAYGFTFDNCDETFTSLGMAAFQASYQALTAVNNLLETTFDTPQEKSTALSQLYDAIGRIIMTNQSIKDKESLQNIIMGAVQKVFFNSKNHLEDIEKIPFSDANIYSEFISTLASTINKESIKRKHPGSGSVLVPGYNTMMYYEIGGNKMMATDILNAARKEYRTELENIIKTDEYEYDEISNSFTLGEDVYILDALSLRELEQLLKNAKLPIVSKYYNNIEDVTDKNDAMIKAYLNGKQAEVTIMDDDSWFMPSDIVDIMDSTGTEVIKTVDLNNLDTYYDLKFGVFEAQADYNVTIKSDYKKGSFEIFLNDENGKPLEVLAPDGKKYKQSFKLEAEYKTENNKKIPTGKYNIHFKTGYLNSLTQRREIIPNATLPKDWKERLFKAALRIMPEGKTLRLSPTTKQQITDKQGGLTAGSIAGYRSIGSDTSRVDGTIIQAGEQYTVYYFDVASNIFVPTSVTEYTKIGQTKSHKYRENIIRPHNLRPSIIRWQEDDGTGKLVYKNIFDTAPIKNAYVFPDGKHKGYRKEIQDLLHELESGKYTENGITKEVHNLENYAAELIMSNIYQDKFDIGNDSLYDVLSQGEDYFIKKEGKTLKAPVTWKYDIAFLSDTGKSTLITLGNVIEDQRTTYRVDFSNNELSTNEDDEIYYMSHNKPLFKIGRWIDVNDVLYDKDTNTFTRNGEKVKSSEYRIKGDKIQKRIMYVERYSLLTTVNKGKDEHYIRHTLFKLASIEDFMKAMKPVQRADENLVISAQKQRASIIRHMYGNSKVAYINTSKNWIQYGKKNPIETLEMALSFIKEDKYISNDVKDLLNSQIEQIRNTVRPPLAKNATQEQKDAENKILEGIRKQNRKTWRQAQQAFLAKEAHKKWVSFQDSVNFIASRIPAQTLQSFMAMKLVAWTQNSKNMAYVSHFQTYLQGSDYDIDKAYIMGQSYDEQATYIGWSNLFDYTSVKTLQASKELPIPKGDIWTINAKSILKEEGLTNTKSIEYKKRYTELTSPIVNNNSHDINIDKYLELQNKGLDNLTEEERVQRLKYLTKIIRSMEKSNKNLYYQGQDTAGIKDLIKLIRDHEFTPIHPEISEAAYKNVASANIYAVSHDIRNRDQAYTAITVATLHDAAEASPKGKQASSLNMLNPLTKYVMQYQNLVGKNVISIAANGEKVWFSAYYYWHKVLESGNKDDINRLKFSQTFKRIAGRSKGTPYAETKSYLPDLDIRNQKIRDALEKEFGVDPDSEEYVYVDQLISQLLSAATDNAKELILDKINAGMNFARMYVYAIVAGYDINDIVAFMTSPAASFIDKMSAANIFQYDSVYNSANSAISLSKGYINANKYLHGNIKLDDNIGGLEDTYTQNTKSKITYVFDRVKSAINKLDAATVNSIKEYLEIAPEDKFTNLSDTVRGLINILIENNIDFDFTKLFENRDVEINTYLAYCQNLYENLRSIYGEYNSVQDARDDIKEFEKLYNLSTEMSQIATAYLSLNQGLPTSELDIIKRLTNMTKIIQNREKALKIRSYEIFSSEGDISENTEDDFWETTYQQNKQKKSSKKNKAENLEKLVDRILENNITLNNQVDSREIIKERLHNAYKAGIMNKFNATKYVMDKEYRQKVKDYYELIMGTLNVFDMMDKIPTYQRNLECLRLLITSNGLSAKSRFINKLIYKKNNITDKDLPNVIRYANQLIAYNFASKQVPIFLQHDFEGLNEYFLPENTDVIKLDSLNGISTFRKWVETDFLNDIKNRYSRNGAIKHLIKLVVDDQEMLAMDIDMLSPNTSTESALAYDEILRGMAELDQSNVKYNDTDYTISDILQLYNIIVHNNQYGSERLTTAFKACSNPNSIMKRFFDYISKADLQEEDIDNYVKGEINKEEIGGLNYDTIDYYIAIAPIISEYSESVHNEPFVKVRDDMQGYILKHLTPSNTYEKYPLVTGVPESSGRSMEARKNFALYSPMLFVNSHSVNAKIKFLDFESVFNVNSLEELQEFDEENNTDLVNKLKKDLLNVLSQYSISSKLWIFKKC